MKEAELSGIIDQFSPFLQTVMQHNENTAPSHQAESEEENDVSDMSIVDAENPTIDKLYLSPREEFDAKKIYETLNFNVIIAKVSENEFLVNIAQKQLDTFIKHMTDQYHITF